MRHVSQFLYVHILKPILFLFPADDVHDFFLKTGNMLGKHQLVNKFFKRVWAYDNDILSQKICGLDFKNPIGLSAGFDYDADLVEILPNIGFGFNTVGTLTHEPYAGNPPPMLARLPKSRSLLVNKGFKNKGVTQVLARLNNSPREAPRGVSIGATNKPYPDFNALLEGLKNGFLDAERFNNFNYYELNISCPNLLNIKNLEEQLGTPTGLKRALETLVPLRLQRPVFIKMPVERSMDEINKLMEVAHDFPFIHGLIFSNLVKDRTNKAFDSEEIKKAGSGNFSGKPVEEKSNDIIRYAYRTYHSRFILVGVGGVFTAEDAYRKIRLGASLVQLITGMVFMGPQQIGLINKELASLIQKDGYATIKDAVGTLA